MFCKNCGKEIEDSAKFCDGCGASVEGTTSQNSGAAKALLGEIKVLFKGFFSKNPASVIELSKNNKTNAGIVFIILNALLYGLAFCCNLSQVLNHLVDSMFSGVKSAASDLFGSKLAEDALSSVTGTVEELPVMWDLLLPFVIAALIVTAIIVGSIYIILKIKKQPTISAVKTLNQVGVSGLPLTIVLVLNLIFGLVLPQYTLLLFAVGVLMSIILLYETLKEIFNTEKPIFEITILLALILILATIVFNIALDKLGESIVNELSSQITGTFGDMLKNSLF